MFSASCTGTLGQSPPPSLPSLPRPCSAARRAPPGWSRSGSPPAWQQCLQGASEKGPEGDKISGTGIARRGPGGQERCGVASNTAKSAALTSGLHQPPPGGIKHRGGSTHQCPSRRRRRWPGPSCRHGRYGQSCGGGAPGARIKVAVAMQQWWLASAARAQTGAAFNLQSAPGQTPGQTLRSNPGQTHRCT